MPPTFESDYRMSELEYERLIRPRFGPDGRNLSKIARFYDGRSVFVTGATGFVGRLLVEKLLRACNNIRRVYVLVRAKKGKSAEQRVADFTSSIVFDGLRRMGIKLDEKIVPIEGDLTRDCYAISQNHLQQLAENVTVIFHSAASVNFQEPLRDAVLTNVVGALNALKLAKQLPKLQALVYVSTAYSNCATGQIQVDERVYPSKLDPMALIQVAEALDRDSMELIKRHLLGPFPNTYTFTKNLAENLCLSHSDKLPVVICRPSVVASTWREPIEGFVDNINGGNGINYGPASGLSAVMQADPSVVLDYVPVDVVVNCVICLGWFCAIFNENKQMNFIQQLELNQTGEAQANSNASQSSLTDKMKKFHEQKLAELAKVGLPQQLASLPVFHATSGVENEIKFGVFKNKMIANANKYPTLQLYRSPSMLYVRDKRLFDVIRFFRNTLMARLFDFIYSFNLLKPDNFDENDPIVKKKLAFRSERIDNFGQTIAFFLTNHWEFSTNNRLSLVDDFMSEEDRHLFCNDMRQLNWDEYCEIYSLGIRKFLLKEPLDTLDRARSRMGLIRLGGLTIKSILVVILLLLPFTYLL